ncbi:hypothetical protein NTGHW29_450062 [Candidatus Nitrotoga sp. HW29]|uniref:hypothetical protein n=1 Tax=Candidatus Nitrotoga sp. HW29 TaxID=2886963 RepID=UPI001EF304D2|nr:hypothetical protein [Candidatus Nitrotoga sp. HW29]CAH1905162.1 hypothetical protein NTGHW29_450062 [Candidatus Nitrotoga sp. HW29]
MGEEFSNAPHQSVMDGEAHLYRKAKGKEAKLSFMVHLLTENRNDGRGMQPGQDGATIGVNTP